MKTRVEVAILENFRLTIKQVQNQRSKFCYSLRRERKKRKKKREKREKKREKREKERKETILTKES